MLDDYMNYTEMDIIEEPISDIEAARIKKMIVKKVGQKQGTRKKRMAAALVACCLMLTGATAFAFTELNIADAFRAIFGEKASYLENIYPIEQGVSNAGLTVTARGAAGYDKVAFMLVEIARDDGKPFIGDNLETAVTSLDVEGLSDYSTGSSGISVVDGKAVITFNLQSTEELKGRNVSINIGDICYRELKFEKASLDMSGDLKLPQADAADLVENTAEIAGYVSRYEPRSTRKPFFAKYVRNAALIPEKIAASQDLGLPLLAGKPGLLLDTAAFVDGKLHVRVLNMSAGYDRDEVLLYMMDPQTGDIAPMMVWNEPAEGMNAMYYVYDISDVSQLEQYEPMVEYYGEYETFEGSWNVKFVLDNDAEGPDFRPAVDMQGYDDSLVLDEIYVTPTATYVRFLPKDSQKVEVGLSLTADIRMKDGSYIHYNNCSCSSLNQEYLEFTGFYDPIDISEIDAITVKSWDQQINDQTDRWFNETFKYID